jgi:hypothetical protein
VVLTRYQNNSSTARASPSLPPAAEVTGPGIFWEGPPNMICIPSCRCPGENRCCCYRDELSTSRPAGTWAAGMVMIIASQKLELFKNIICWKHMGVSLHTPSPFFGVLCIYLLYIYLSIYLFIYLHISRSHIQSHNYHILLLYIFWLIGWFANSCQNRLRGCSIRTLAIRILPGTQGAESSWCLPQGCLHMTNIEQYGENMWKQWK